MKDIEDRLRDAYRAAGATVRPETIRELHQVTVRPLHARRRRVPWMGLLLPAGAAAAVTALVLGALAITPKAAGTGHGATAAKAAIGRVQAAAARLPKFIVSPDGSSLDVIRTATGRAAGKAAAPAGQSFESVAGTADDRTFLVAADLNPQTACETFLYKVQLSDSGQPSAPTPVAFSSLAGVLPTAVAMSADGRTAALSTVRCAAEIAGNTGGTPGIGGFYLVNMAAGQVTRQWSYALADDYTHDMSLSADGSRLAFTMLLPPSNRHFGIKTLATSAPSGTLDSVSHVVLRPPQARASNIEAAQLSADGSTLYACTSLSTSYPESITTLAAYSAATGRQTRVLRTWPPAAALSCSLTIDPSGRNLLVTVSNTPDGQLTKPMKKQLMTRRNPFTTRLFAVDLASGVFSTLPIQISGPSVQGGFAW